MDGYKHYIRLDANNFITKRFSDAFEQVELGDICVNEDGGRHYNEPVINERGQYCFKYENGIERLATEEELFDLDAYRAIKISELWNSCNQDIESGFLSSATGTEYLYGFDSQDRENIVGTLSLMNSIPQMTHVEWKPKGVAPFLHTREQFLLICQDAFTHKQSKINQYWVMRGQIENAVDKATIDAIVW